MHQWSLDEPAAFWRAVWDFTEIQGDPGSIVCDDPSALPGCRWFPNATLNFAENLLRFADDSEALVEIGESNGRRALTYGQLREQVAQIAGWMREHNIQPGDRVAGFMPNCIETVVAMLATTSLGAVWSSCSPDFGKQGALDRFDQIAPRLLFTADGYVYNGKNCDSLARAGDIARAIPEIEHVVVVPKLASQPALGGIEAAVSWGSCLSGDIPALRFEPRSFNDPLFILYSSGTTGVPKCIVHGVGGTLIQHAKEHALHADISRNDRFFYFTTCGWMMWNWLVSVLASEATAVLYEGSPAFPETGVLFDVAERHRVGLLGVSAGWINAVRQSGLRPVDSHDLSPLKTICSTGSPLSPEGFAYVYEAIKPDVQLASISGGTDIVSCFVLGNPTAPVFEGQIQCAGLGMDVDVADEQGRSLPPGEKGELVCRSPFPSMPVGFWNDPDGERYRAAYFEHFPGVWHHGDFAEKTEQGGFIIHGRSDATLNPGGVRIGTAELYRVLERMSQINEAAAIGAAVDGDVRIVLFVVTRDGTLDDELARAIRTRLRSEASPRHVPRDIFAVDAIPKTRTGKTAELALKTWIEGRVVRNRNALVGAELFDTPPPALSP